MEVVYVILGWLFGLLGPSIVDRIKKSYTKKDLFGGIKTELSECQYSMVNYACRLGMRAGKYDREFLEWVLPYFEKYQGSEVESKKNLIKLIKTLLENEDEVLEKIVTSDREEKKGYSLSLKTIHLPFLMSKISELSLFCIELQKIIYEIISRLKLINEEIDSAIKYHYMTFDSAISDDNHDIIRNELDEKYRGLQSQLLESGEFFFHNCQINRRYYNRFANQFYAFYFLFSSFANLICKRENSIDKSIHNSINFLNDL